MKPELVATLSCPACRGILSLSEAGPIINGEIAEGALVCGGCRASYPVIDSIPRFVSVQHYTESFGFQWNQHAVTQLDSQSGATITRQRFETVTRWNDLAGATLLEVGCGSGRFTQVALETGAEVFSVDASRAVEANYKNNAPHPRAHFLQADLYRLPFSPGQFDKVMCLGVLQHCPDVEQAFMSLARQVKSGGELVIDVYDLTFRALVNPKYWLRPITRRIPHDTLYRMVRRIVPVVYPVKEWVTDHIPVIGRYLAFLIPVAYHKGYIAGAERLTYEQRVEWSILDTFDKFSPAYDQPQRLSTVRRWFAKSGFTDVEVGYGPNGIVGRGRRPIAQEGQKPSIGFLWHGDRNIGGGEYGTWLLARSLEPEFKPILLHARDNALTARYTQDGIELVKVDISPRLTGVYRDRVGAHPFRWAGQAWHFVRAVFSVVRIVRERRVTILHPVDNLSKLIAGIAARLARVPVVTHCREELGNGRVERLLLKFQESVMDRVIAVADRIADQFGRGDARPRHVVTIHNGLDLKAFQPDRMKLASDVDWSWKPTHVGIGIIATFDAIKGHTYLFQACERLKAQGVRNWRCLVVGDGRERDRIMGEIAARDLHSDVQCLGYRHNVAEILKGLDLVVIPSEHEGFPRIALEAMAMELPVVASNVGGVAEAVQDGETGVLVPPGDVEALARAIKAMISSPERRRHMGAQGRRRVEQLFSLEQSVRKTMDVYREVLRPV